MKLPASSEMFSVSKRPAPDGRSVGSARLWLSAGALAGPVLIVSSLVQGSVRSGFDFQQHPPSALELGGAGVVQQATFVLAGLLLLAGARGMGVGECGRWAPGLVAVLGAALTAAGLFTMDPAFGFPPGTPPGAGDTVSWHAAVHGVLFPVGGAALVATAVVMGQRYGRAKRRSMQTVAYVAAAASLVLSIWPNLGAHPDGRFLPMWLGVVIGYLWTSLMFTDLARAAADESDGRTAAGERA
ncbi:DUF998 domain-containing protein [Skermania sp. ID1734]|uniref:DUF998 domain-containing protein n=1 Tax=Skermania sp. ID1734 TaxID=2597516 RepID=UPI001180633E|nr:DUF998 domain-containing protein [Skermania sp. ID1734]TSD99790.1 DUF998 domain-containing protein [Skermania sp. ID1734]